MTHVGRDAVTLDLFSRKVVGWSMGESLESKLVLLDHKMHLTGMVAGCARDGIMQCMYARDELEKPGCWTAASQ